MGIETRTCVLIAAVACLSACSADAMPPREILFQSLPLNDTEDIYALDFETGELRRLTQGAPDYANSFPAWSPTANVFAFVRQFDDRDHLYIRDENGADTHLLDPSELWALGPPTWSPDGNTILIPAGESRERLRLHQVDLRTSTVVELPMPEGRFDCGSFAPEGRRIVTSRQAPPLSEILVFDLGSHQWDVVVASDTLGFHCPEWSPSGDVVAIALYRRDPVRADITILDLASGEFHPVTAGPGLNNAPRWSRGGDWIVYQCSDLPSVPEDAAGAARFYRSMEICAIRPDGSDRRQLTENQHFDAHPSW